MITVEQVTGFLLAAELQLKMSTFLAKQGRFYYSLLLSVMSPKSKYEMKREGNDFLNNLEAYLQIEGGSLSRPKKCCTKTGLFPFWPKKHL